MKAVLLLGRKAHKEIEETVHMYDEIFDDIEEVLLNPPHTWKKYMGKEEGPIDILNMELEELNTALEKKHYHELYKECCHVAAATVHAICEMKKKK